MKNQVIEVINEEHGREVIEYWKSKGINAMGMFGSLTKEDGDEWRYYGVIGDKFDSYSIEFVHKYNAEIIELPKEENSFPRVILVSDDAVVWNQAVVECLRGGYAFATIKYSSVEEYEDALKRGAAVPFYFWKHIKEISDRNKVTKSEIAEKFGISIDQLVIKDD